MYTYRITKYNPEFRDERGAYKKDEWTEFSDIGKRFDGQTLTKAEYMQTEDSYVKVLLSLLEESGIEAMKINREQNFRGIKHEGRLIRRNQVYGLQNLEQLFRLVLRGELWCKFKNKDGSYVDFGWDYYAYIGVPRKCENSIKLAKRRELYIEECPEPILD
jgi:hypothetical protein